MVREYLDDPNGKRWSDTNLNIAIQFVLDDLWSDMLDVAPYINSQYQQIPLPLHTPGFIDLKLTAFGGDLTQRFYRMQQVIADGRHYFPKDPRDYLMVAQSLTNDPSTIQASTGIEQRFSYQFLGDQVWLHPLGAVTTFVELRYNFRPVAFSQLADGTTLPMPEGSEQSLVLLSAAYAMGKGNAEESMQLQALGEQSRQRLMNSIRRQYHGMTVAFSPENPWAYGGT